MKLDTAHIKTVAGQWVRNQTRRLTTLVFILVVWPVVYAVSTNWLGSEDPVHMYVASVITLVLAVLWRLSE